MSAAMYTKSGFNTCFFLFAWLEYVIPSHSKATAIARSNYMTLEVSNLL